MSRSRALAALQTISALAGIASMGAIGGRISEPRDRCPQCRKGRLVKSVTGARYCHRCAWFESAEVAECQTRLEKILTEQRKR